MEGITLFADLKTKCKKGEDCLNLVIYKKEENKTYLIRYYELPAENIIETANIIKDKLMYQT